MYLIYKTFQNTIYNMVMYIRYTIYAINIRYIILYYIMLYTIHNTK